MTGFEFLPSVEKQCASDRNSACKAGHCHNVILQNKVIMHTHAGMTLKAAVMIVGS